MKIIGFLIIFVVYILANFYVFHHIWMAMPPNTIGRVSLVSFAVIAVSSFFLSFFLGDSMPVWLASGLYKIGTAWLFILLYFFIVMAAKDLFGLANKLLHFMPGDAITRYTKENWVGLGFMVGFITLVMVCGYLKYQSKVRVELPVETSKIIGDSILTKPLRIVAISDLHLGYGIGKKEFETWVELINAEKPDMVLIAGDIIDNSVRPLEKGNFAESFHKIKAPMGIYACPGNHEYISGIKGSLDFIEKTGVRLLRDSVAEVDSCIYVIGRDDRSNEGRKSLKELTDSLDHSKFIILLDHQPYNLEESEQQGVDLQISGHTHQGQVWPISAITKALYEIDHGFLKKGNTDIFVSSGIGIWGGKFRIGTQSEYVVIDIDRKR
ncbi:metallophosphoesterase [Dysgonomonas sp. BGC7]|uniref:metallophosphoesterase n=1 Tax=Dysgonomonas sp. BGC7 TaxID=1658008 RepID=UPI000682A676|nr:metallophosphoesterase [Dysgonomonas sp. BGC7]MBD8389716.1 metallophosphoesterase [Dysgonomonas sp. BGC7]